MKFPPGPTKLIRVKVSTLSGWHLGWSGVWFGNIILLALEGSGETPVPGLEVEVIHIGALTQAQPKNMSEIFLYISNLNIYILYIKWGDDSQMLKYMINLIMNIFHHTDQNEEGVENYILPGGTRFWSISNKAKNIWIFSNTRATRVNIHLRA